MCFLSPYSYFMPSTIPVSAGHALFTLQFFISYVDLHRHYGFPLSFWKLLALHGKNMPSVPPSLGLKEQNLPPAYRPRSTDPSPVGWTQSLNSFLCKTAVRTAALNNSLLSTCYLPDSGWAVNQPGEVGILVMSAVGSCGEDKGLEMGEQRPNLGHRGKLLLLKRPQASHNLLAPISLIILHP